MPYSREHKTKTRQRILDCATELFCRSGFERVSISQVMSLAKMTHGAFYAHFESKEALYKASFLQTVNTSRASRLAKFPFSIKHLTQLVSNLLNLRSFAEQQGPAPENILINEIGSRRREIRELYEKSYLGLLKILEKRITALCKLKKLPFAPSRTVVREKSRAILAAMIGAIAISRSIQSEEEIRRVLVAAQNQILSLLGVGELSVD